MNERSDRNIVRKRRSWYRRRRRLQRAVIATAMVLGLAGIGWQSAARYFALPTLHASNFLPESFWTRGDIRDRVALMSHARAPHASPQAQGTYPYSVVPGGVRDAADLEERAARDYVVRRHFAGFDYRHARLVRSDKTREVYLSYRIRDRIFWTRKKVRLLQAELLLTDGKITARARCGNQVSETPKSEISEEEPDEAVLDEPVADILPIGPSLPFRFPSVKPNLPSADAIPPRAPQLFAGGFNFPYVNFGIAVPRKLCKPGDNSKHCHHHHPPPIPEPTTFVLIASGLAAVFWRYRRTERAMKSLLPTTSS